MILADFKIRLKTALNQALEPENRICVATAEESRATNRAARAGGVPGLVESLRPGEGGRGQIE
jgi:hypothetical protein